MLQSDPCLRFRFPFQLPAQPEGRAYPSLPFSENHILNDTGLHMSDMRLAVCSRRPVIEHINGMSLILSNALVEDVIVLPELRRFLLALNEIQVGVYLVVHNTSFADLSRQSAERNIV